MGLIESLWGQSEPRDPAIISLRGVVSGAMLQYVTHRGFAPVYINRGNKARFRERSAAFPEQVQAVLRDTQDPAYVYIPASNEDAPHFLIGGNAQRVEYLQAFRHLDGSSPLQGDLAVLLSAYTFRGSESLSSRVNVDHFLDAFQPSRETSLSYSLSPPTPEVPLTLAITPRIGEDLQNGTLLRYGLEPFVSAVASSVPSNGKANTHRVPAEVRI